MIDTKISLTAVIELGQSEDALALIQNGADVNAPDQNGDPPICIAAKYNNDAIVEHLINAGAIVENVNDSYGRTANQWAEIHGNEKMLNKLNSVVTDQRKERSRPKKIRS